MNGNEKLIFKIMVLVCSGLLLYGKFGNNDTKTQLPSGSQTESVRSLVVVKHDTLSPGDSIVWRQSPDVAQGGDGPVLLPETLHVAHSK